MLIHEAQDEAILVCSQANDRNSERSKSAQPKEVIRNEENEYA